MKGFASDNYQARVNSLTLGLDNWVYGANGLLGGNIADTARKTTLDVRGSLNRWTQNYAPQTYNASTGAQAIGLPASLVNQFEEPSRFPYITASNYQYLGESGSNIWYAPSTNWSLARTWPRPAPRRWSAVRWPRWTG